MPDGVPIDFDEQPRPNGKDESSAGEAEEWPDPEPLGGELPPVKPFDVDLLPESLRVLAEDVAERMQVACDYPAIVAVLCLAGVTGRRATIQPRALDTTWTVTPNLWGGLVAPPGMMKSPLISAITRPLTRIEATWRTEYTAAVADYERQQEEARLDKAVWEADYKKAKKAGKPIPSRPEESDAEPVCCRLITQDATAEKLHVILSENPAGVLVIRDELAGWVATLDKLGREGERGFFLSAWNGDTPYTIDRIERGSIYVEACCVSMLGGIQPARLCGYLSDALKDGPQNDGLIQRFQLLVWPEAPSDWRYVDRLPWPNGLELAEKVFRAIAGIDVREPLRFRYAGDAQELFVDWFTDLERKVRGDELHPALIAHLSKYRSLMPSLALLFELADGGHEQVSLRHTQQACDWCDYLESHARRVYASVVAPERQAAAELGRRLKAGWKRQEGMFTVREVYNNNWRGLSEPEEARRALEFLEDAGWVRRMELVRTNHRPSELYGINPKLARSAK